ncbi:hypothetical protein U5817_13000 [Aromatoleum evansii]|uniref:Secreted protein n=1 Tax=Aromatoleum evansii TaxID=59406 RepID=A0ABZ1AE37_AROEV|nr:hypothetical protein U5817_13000 [Aromatoleum evansii]
MTAFKDVLCLLAIFIAYGIVGRLDYEDAVRLEQITQERQHAECLTAMPPVREPAKPISNPSSDPPNEGENRNRPGGSRCWPRSM